MAILIIWADEARKTFDKNISYLLQEWTERELSNFVKQTNHVLLRIAAHPEKCTPHHKKTQK